MNPRRQLLKTCGLSGILAFLVVVAAGCPWGGASVKVSFVAQPVTGQAPLAVTFQGKVDGLKSAAKFRVNPGQPPDDTPPVTVKAWNWAFGDGQTAQGQSVQHTYNQPGNYDVTLSVVLSDGTTPSKIVKNCVTVTQPNRAPVANAGPDQNVALGALVHLDASGSSDADSDTLAYAWSMVSKPEGSSALLSNLAAVGPTFTADLAGEYVFRLVVNDGKLDSEQDAVRVHAAAPENRPPTADAGVDQNVVQGANVQLSGAGSSDPDGDALTYLWSFASRPQGSQAAFSNAAIVNPTFTADVVGTYQVQLLVNDGKVSSVADAVTVTAGEPPNHAPVANAGPDREVQVGTAVTLDGSGSSDADQDSLTFAWSFVSRPNGSAASLDNVSAQKPTFTPDAVGQYILRLVVNDGKEDSAPDTVSIAADPILNQPPTADAGPDQTVQVGATVHLDGSGSSDADSDPLTFGWSFVSQPSGSAATLTNPTSATPSFTAAVAGAYQLRLVVNDGKVDSAADTVTVQADPAPNRTPVANAGPDQNAQTGATVHLDGAGSSDPDGDPLTFAWSFVSRAQDSTAELDDPASVTPSFVADKAGEYRVRLIVYDQTPELRTKAASAPDEIVVTVTGPPNTAPVADAGPSQEVLLGGAVHLDGSNSTDPDGDPITYAWSFVSRPDGSAAVLDDPAAVKPGFTADVVGAYELRLVVNDGKVDGEPDTVTITVGETPNTAPVADAGPDRDVVTGATVTLDGSGSHDADNQPITYLWTIVTKPAGSAAAFVDGTLVGPTFVADLPGQYVTRLVVNDGRTDSDADTVTITATGTANAAPQAFAGLDRSVFRTSTVQLDGSGSVDADGNPLTYRWSFASVPGGSAAVLSSTTAANPTFPADFPGTYVVQLIVNDGKVDGAPDTVVVEVLEQHPPELQVKQASYTVQDGHALTFTVGATDPDGDPVVLSAAPALANAAFVATNGVNATGTFTFSPTSEQKGIQPIVFTARDPQGLTDERQVTITVTHVNRPPVLDVSADVSVTEGKVLTIPLVYSDPDGDIVTTSASPLPDNSLFVPSTATITFAPDYSQAGEYTIHCEASDGQATSGQKAVHVTVVDVPGQDPDSPHEVNLVLTPLETPTLQKTLHVTGTVNVGTDLPPPASITSAIVNGLNPAQGRQGETMDVTLTSQTGKSLTKRYETHFVDGASAADFGEGVTVQKTQVLSASELVATIEIASDAPIGARPVTVQTGNEVAVSMVAFNVIKGVTRVTGTLVDPVTGKPIAGATVTVQGTNISTTTDENGAFTLSDVPVGSVVILVNPPNHRLMRIATDTASNEQIDLGAIQSEPTVFDPTSAPSASLFSVLGRGFSDPTGGMAIEDAEKVVRDAMLLAGGSEGGVLDDYGNQLNPNVQGAGLVSLTPSGVALLAQKLARGGETVMLADVLYAISFGFEWEGGTPPTLDQWLDTLQALVNQAWKDPNATENQLVVMMFNKGDQLLFNPPTLGPDTRLNPLQAYFFMTSLWAEFGDREQAKSAKAQGKSVAPKAGRSLTSFWRNANSMRSTFINGPGNGNGIVGQAAVNYLLYMNSLMLPMPGVLGMTMNLAARAPMAGVVFDQMTGAFGFAAMANAIPEPPTQVKHHVNKGGDGRVSVQVTFALSRNHPQTFTELPAYLYSLYRFSTPGGERKLVGYKVIMADDTVLVVDKKSGILIPMAVKDVQTEEQWRSVRLALFDSDPLPAVTTGTGDVVQAPAATWFYALTVTEVNSGRVAIGEELANKTIPWWTLPLTRHVDGLTPFVLNSRKVRTSDYTAPIVVTVTSTGDPVHTDEIEVDPRNGDVYYSDTEGNYTVGPTGQPAFYSITQNGTGNRALFAESGFKTPGHRGLAIDSLGNLYTDNAASDDAFGGRLFQFAQPNGAKSFTGSINYYSRDLMFANPVAGGPLAMGPGATPGVSKEDLYVVEKLSNSVRRAPVQATYDPYRRVAQPWAGIPFTSEPLDLEIRPSGDGELLVHRVAAAALGCNALLSDTFLMPKRDLTITVRATNPTLSAITHVMPLPPVFSEPSVVEFVSGPDPATVDLASYGSQDFVYHYRTAASGLTRVYGQVQGQDPQNVTISSPQAPPGGNILEVGCPLEFVSLEAKPDQTAPGGTITIKGRVANRGSTAFRDVVPTLTVAQTGAEYPGQVTYLDGPVPASTRLEGEASQEFVWHYEAADFGEVAFEAKVAGVEEVSSEAVLSRPYQSNTVLITPVEVTLTIDPTTILFKEDTVVSAKIAVTNTGTKPLENVTPSLVQKTGKGTFATIEPVDATPVTLAAGAKKTFEYKLKKPVTAGPLTFVGAIDATTQDGKAIPTTKDTKEVIIGPRLHIKVYDVLLRINASDMGFDPAIFEKRYPLGEVELKVRPYPFEAHPESEFTATSDAQGEADLAVPEKRAYEVRGEVTLAATGPNKEPLKIGFKDRIYALTDDVHDLTVQLPKSMLDRTFELLKEIKEIDAALGRFPVWGSKFNVKVGYYELYDECTRVLIETFCKGVDTPLYRGNWAPGGYRQAIAWDALPRLALMLGFGKVRLDETSETTCNFVKSILPAVWTSNAGSAFLDKCNFKGQREQFGEKLDLNGQKIGLRKTNYDVGREMTLRLAKSVTSYLSFMIPPQEGRDELIERTQECVDWAVKLIWAVGTWKGLDDFAKTGTQMAVTAVAVEGFIQPIYINKTTQPMLMEVVHSVQNPSMLRGGTLDVLKAIADYDVTLRGDYKGRKSTNENAQNAFTGADDFNSTMEAISAYAKQGAGSTGKVSEFVNTTSAAGPVLKRACAWLLLLDAARTAYVLSIVEPSNVCVASKKIVNFDLGVDLDWLGAVSALLGKVDTPMDTYKRGAPPPMLALAKQGGTEQLPEAAAYAAAADVFLPILQTGDPTAVRAGVSTFLDAHRQVDAAMNLAAKRTEAIAGTLPEEPALEQPTNQAVRLAGQAARERDYVILMLHSVLELDEGVDGLAKAAELLDEAKASTMAAAEALNPLILRNKSLVVPATFYIDVEAPLEAPPGTTRTHHGYAHQCGRCDGGEPGVAHDTRGRQRYDDLRSAA